MNLSNRKRWALVLGPGLAGTAAAVWAVVKATDGQWDRALLYGALGVCNLIMAGMWSRW